MRSIHRLMLSSALAAAGVLPAAAQMYPGQGVSVNPGAAGTQVLLYPGGHYARIVPPLAQPGARTLLEPIHLHMPASRRVARIRHRAHGATAVASAETAPAIGPPPISDAPSPTPDTPPAPVPRHRHAAKTQEPSIASNPDAAIPFSFTGAPAPKAEQKPAPTEKTASPAKLASAEPPPEQTAAPEEHGAKPDDSGLSKRGEIVFRHDATDPAPAQFDGLKLLAGDLASALQAGATRVMLEAYGGAPGDKGSDARRLSLKRALAIRQVLIDNGVPSTKIDVRAMGGIDDRGNADRVDVYVRAG